MARVKEETWVKLEEPLRKEPAVFKEPTRAMAIILADNLFASLTSRGGKVSVYAFDPKKVASEPLSVRGK